MTNTSASPAPILLLGDPVLRRKCSDCTEDEIRGSNEQFNADRAALEATLQEFRRTHGFGRAISAPQIGVSKRMIALDLTTTSHLQMQQAASKGIPTDRAFVMYNPIIVWKSPETFYMWDDCFSFSHLLVRVKRHRSVSVVWTNEHNQRISSNHLDQATSELLQHEIDHLDGVLAVDRQDATPRMLHTTNTTATGTATGTGNDHNNDGGDVVKVVAQEEGSSCETIIYREEFNKRKQYYNAMVDYIIQ
eukprot:GEZU01016720.1.p1 GENE.GEZU01016720.1~~GEZU01016720.1.p1  ORF type:complete len:269 (+),score=43.31 GEZU01016720.1:66-809(+)